MKGKRPATLSKFSFSFPYCLLIRDSLQISYIFLILHSFKRNICATERLRLYLQSNSCKYMRRDIFRSIADPTRRAILGLLALQAMTPNAVAEHFDSSRQAVSKHIQILTECEAVKQQQNGRE